MQRREFLKLLPGAPLAVWTFERTWAASPTDYRRVLILIELKGGNDGLNTVVPFSDPEYYRLRPKLGIARDQLIHLDERIALHPSLETLMPAWNNREVAIVQGVGYPQPNLSHFRSIEIWDTASDSHAYLDKGWLTQIFVRHPVPRGFAADGVVIGSAESGPLAGGGTRTISLRNTGQFRRQALQMEGPSGSSRNPALAHILKVEGDIRQAANGLRGDHVFRTEFPKGQFGNNIRTAAQVLAASSQVAVVRITHNGFDTHSNQLQLHSRLLRELSEGLVALKSALLEIDRWTSALVMTSSEFGRRPKENGSQGTDHGTANVHLLAGGRIRGGLYGQYPSLTSLDGGNLRHNVDFRALYATVAELWWGISSAELFGGSQRPIAAVRS